MVSDPTHVIVTNEECSCHTVHSLAAHHRDLPELRGEGRSPEDAAVRLAEMLSRSLDSVPNDWRREIILHAIEDVRAFTEGCALNAGTPRSRGGRMDNSVGDQDQRAGSQSRGLDR